MKTRLRGQSVRFRLSRSEVAALSAGESVASRTSIVPGRAVEFVLRPSSSAGQIASTVAGDALIFTFPASQATELAETDTVGFSADLPAGDGLTLRVLIEKDFACIDGPPDESQEDAFPNRSAAC